MPSSWSEASPVTSPAAFLPRPMILSQSPISASSVEGVSIGRCYHRTDLAKKAKTPPPPRRPVQAPKQRAAERTPAERRTLLYLLIFSAAGLVMVGAVVAFVALAGGGGNGSSAISSKYCVEQAYPGLSAKHLGSPDAKVKYNSFPPSSGPHYQSPAPWGIYTESVKQP